jgi:hypothetical protein
MATSIPARPHGAPSRRAQCNPRKMNMQEVVCAYASNHSDLARRWPGGVEIFMWGYNYRHVVQLAKSLILYFFRRYAGQPFLLFLDITSSPKHIAKIRALRRTQATTRTSSDWSPRNTWPWCHMTSVDLPNRFPQPSPAPASSNKPMAGVLPLVCSNYRCYGWSCETGNGVGHVWGK